MSIIPSADDLKAVVQNLSSAVLKSEDAFKHVDMDDYETEMFYKALCDCKNFVATLDWLIKRHYLYEEG